MNANWSWQFIFKKLSSIKKKSPLKYVVLDSWSLTKKMSIVYKESTLQKGLSNHLIHLPTGQERLLVYQGPLASKLGKDHNVIPYWSQHVVSFDFWIDEWIIKCEFVNVQQWTCMLCTSHKKSQNELF